MSVKIVTDSTADIPAEVVQALGITVVPLTVHFGDKVYRDGVDIDAERFLAALATSRALPHTAQPPPGAFVEVYRALLDQGHDIISIHLSSKLSGTINSALLARQEAGATERITVVDSLWTSMALGLVVISAAIAAQQGDEPPQILRLVDERLQKLHLLLFVDTMEYLQRGGRIGRAAAFLGGLLSVKPMITLQEGEVHPIERVRTRSRAIERLWLWASEFPSVSDFCVLHISSLEDAKALFDRIQQRFPTAKGYVASVGPVVGTHVGPGAVGVALCA